MVAVIGDPVKHSLSPVILNAAFSKARIDWVYTAFETPEAELANAIEGVRALGIAGLSVTMPHKSKICSLLDGVSDSAKTLEAVNCVVNDGGEALREANVLLLLGCWDRVDGRERRGKAGWKSNKNERGSVCV